jgi:hypothetical protein
MKTAFHIWLTVAGTLLILAPIIYKAIVTVILAYVVVQEHRASLDVGQIDPFLWISVLCGIAMVLIAVISNRRPS